MPARTETTPGSHPEEPNEYPLKHLAIAIEQHKPWTDDEISLAANLLSNFADIATSLGIEKLTIFSENLTETERINAEIGENNDHIPLTFQSPHEKAQIVEAVKKMKKDGITAEGVLLEELVDNIFPDKPDLVIVTQESFSDIGETEGESGQNVIFTLPGTVLSTAYSEYAVVSSGFLDMTVDDFLASIQEYGKRKRKFGALPEGDKEF